MSITNSDIVQKTKPLIHKTDVRVQLQFVVELEKTEMESIISNLQQQINSSKQMRTLIVVSDHQSRFYLIRKNNLTPESVTPSPFEGGCKSLDLANDAIEMEKVKREAINNRFDIFITSGKEFSTFVKVVTLLGRVKFDIRDLNIYLNDTIRESDVKQLCDVIKHNNWGTGAA